MKFPFFPEKKETPFETPPKPLEHPKNDAYEAINPLLELEKRLAVCEFQLAELRTLLIEQDLRGKKKLTKIGKIMQRRISEGSQ